MLHFNCKILCLLFLFTYCTSKKTSDNQLIVKAPKVSLRAEPSEKSREIALLKAGQGLVDLGEVSSFESVIAVGEVVYQTPWVKVQTTDNQTGWVLGWALKPEPGQQDWLLQKRLNCYFGKDLSWRRNSLLLVASKLETPEQFAKVWRESGLLRDTFFQLLASRPENGFPVQFNWLSDVLPGFLLQKIGESEQPWLFIDFSFWQKQAQQTTGTQDDVFLQYCLAAFPQDSIESFFPVWKFQLSFSESASQLGTGQHLKMLQELDRAFLNAPLFAPELEAFKSQLMEDIFGKNIRYWQSRDRILVELAQILAEPPKCLNEKDLEALNIRKKMFEDPEGNGIIVNMRSGE